MLVDVREASRPTLSLSCQMLTMFSSIVVTAVIQSLNALPTFLEDNFGFLQDSQRRHRIHHQGGAKRPINDLFGTYSKFGTPHKGYFFTRHVNDNVVIKSYMDNTFHLVGLCTLPVVLVAAARIFGSIAIPTTPFLFVLHANC